MIRTLSISLFASFIAATSSFAGGFTLIPTTTMGFQIVDVTNDISNGEIKSSKGEEFSVFVCNKSNVDKVKIELKRANDIWVTEAIEINECKHFFDVKNIKKFSYDDNHPKWVGKLYITFEDRNDSAKAE
jgi:hypothetical protein